MRVRKRSQHRHLGFMLAVALVLANRWARAQDHLSDSSSTLMSGAVVDGDRGIVFVAGATGDTVEALEMATGRVVWRSSDASVPLRSSPQGLLAQGRAQLGALDLVLLDASDGHRIVGWRVELPPTVLPSFNELSGHVFSLISHLEGSLVEVYWAHQVYVCSGIYRPEMDERMHGAAQVNLGTGALLGSELLDPMAWGPDWTREYPPVVLASDGTRVSVAWENGYILVRYDAAGTRVSQLPLAASDSARVTLDGRHIIVGHAPPDADGIATDVYHIDDFETGPRYRHAGEIAANRELVVVAGYLLQSSGSAMADWAVTGDPTPAAGNLQLQGVGPDTATASWSHAVTVPLQVLCTAP